MWALLTELRTRWTYLPGLRNSWTWFQVRLRARKGRGNKKRKEVGNCVWFLHLTHQPGKGGMETVRVSHLWMPLHMEETSGVGKKGFLFK